MVPNFLLFLYPEALQADVLGMRELLATIWKPQKENSTWKIFGFAVFIFYPPTSETIEYLYYLITWDATKSWKSMHSSWLNADVISVFSWSYFLLKHFMSNNVFLKPSMHFSAS